MSDIAYKRRIDIMVHKLKMENREANKVIKAFDDLSILRKLPSKMMRGTNERTFQLKKAEYQEKMKWINEYMKSQGMDEDIFTDLDSFEVSSDDYDYFNELKTEKQYKEEEEARKARKSGTKPSGKEE